MFHFLLESITKYIANKLSVRMYYPFYGPQKFSCLLNPIFWPKPTTFGFTFCFLTVNKFFIFTAHFLKGWTFFAVMQKKGS